MAAGNACLPGREGGEREGISVSHSVVWCSNVVIGRMSRSGEKANSRCGVRDGCEFGACLELQAINGTRRRESMDQLHVTCAKPKLAPGTIFVQVPSTLFP